MELLTERAADLAARDPALRGDVITDNVAAAAYQVGTNYVGASAAAGAASTTLGLALVIAAPIMLAVDLSTSAWIGFRPPSVILLSRGKFDSEAERDSHFAARRREYEAEGARMREEMAEECWRGRCAHELRQFAGLRGAGWNASRASPCGQIRPLNPKSRSSCAAVCVARVSRSSTASHSGVLGNRFDQVASVPAASSFASAYNSCAYGRGSSGARIQDPSKFGGASSVRASTATRRRDPRGCAISVRIRSAARDSAPRSSRSGKRALRRHVARRLGGACRSRSTRVSSSMPIAPGRRAVAGRCVAKSDDLLSSHFARPAVEDHIATLAASRSDVRGGGW